MNPATKRVAGLPVDLLGSPHLLEPSFRHDGEPVGHRQCFALIVRDVDEGDPDLPLEILQSELHLLAQLQIERAQRLVEQEHLRPADESAGECDALPLAARELMRKPRFVARHLDQRERLRTRPATSPRGTLRIRGG